MKPTKTANLLVKCFSDDDTKEITNRETNHIS